MRPGGSCCCRRQIVVNLIFDYFAQQSNGDIAFAILAPTGPVGVEEEIAGIETVKVNISLPSHVKGTIVDVNADPQDLPEMINQEPCVRGWKVIVQHVFVFVS